MANVESLAQLADDSRPRSRWQLTAVIGCSTLASLLLATLSLPVAGLLWIGVSVAVGRGDPTWNDGEEVWGTGLGPVLTAALACVYCVVVRALSRRVGRRTSRVVAGVLIVPAIAVNVAVAASMLSGG